jgi:hypothetical protein
MGNNITGAGFVSTDRFGKVETTTEAETTDTSQAKDKAEAAKSSLTVSTPPLSESTSGDVVLSKVDDLLHTENLADSSEEIIPVPDIIQPEGKDPFEGIKPETKKLFNETSELIDNQVTKYLAILKKNDDPEVKQKLVFWQHEQKMQSKIEGRLSEFGVREELSQEFTNRFNKRAFMLENKAKQGIYADNKPHFYGNLARENSFLTQLATGSSQKQINENRELTNSFANSITTQHQKAHQYDQKIKNLRKEVFKKDISTTRRNEIKKELEQLHKQRNTERLKYQQLKTGARRFGGRARSLNDMQRAQYIAFISDVSALKGDVDTDLLP